MSQVNMVFTMLFEKRSKICPLPKNDDVLAGKKSQAWGGGGLGGGEAGCTSPAHAKRATKAEGATQRFLIQRLSFQLWQVRDHRGADIY